MDAQTAALRAMVGELQEMVGVLLRAAEHTQGMLRESHAREEELLRLLQDSRSQERKLHAMYERLMSRLENHHG